MPDNIFSSDLETKNGATAIIRPGKTILILCGVVLGVLLVATNTFGHDKSVLNQRQLSDSFDWHNSGLFRLRPVKLNFDNMESTEVTSKVTGSEEGAETLDLNLYSTESPVDESALLPTHGTYGGRPELSLPSKEGAETDDSYTGTIRPTNPDGTPYVGTFAEYFKTSLPLFGPEILDGYKDSEEVFKQDLTDVLYMSINRIVARSTFSNPSTDEIYYAASPSYNFSIKDYYGSTTTSSDGSRGANGLDRNVTDFSSNNIEDGPQESDVIVSDGKYVYVSSTEAVKVMDAQTGELFSTFELPSLDNETDSNQSPNVNGEFGPMNNDIDSNSNSSNYNDDAVYNNSTDQAYPFPSYPNSPYNAKPYPRSMTIVGDRLVIISDDYSNSNSFQYQGSTLPNSLFSTGGTAIYVYDVSALSSGDGTVVLLATERVRGSYFGVRTVNNNLHVLASSYLSLQYSVMDRFERYNFPADATDQEYVDAVEKLAAELLPDLINQYIAEFKVQGKIPSYTRIFRPSEDIGDVDIFSYMYHIYSFNPTQDAIDLSTTGGFLPSTFSYTSASDDYVILLSQSKQYGVDFSNDNGDELLLTAFKLDGATPYASAVGRVKGMMSRDNDLSIEGDVIRIGTTATSLDEDYDPEVDTNMPSPTKSDDEVVEEEPTDGGIDAQDFGLNVNDDAIPINRVPEESSFRQIESAYPSSYYNTLPPQAVSKVNYVSTLRITDSKEMEQLDQIVVGEKDVNFSSLRFFGNTLYIVTVAESDPLYVIDLSDPSNLSVIGETDLPEFSNYLHSMNSNDDLILSIGIVNGDEGYEVGLQISVFDTSNPAEPKEVQRYVVENSVDTYSNTAVFFDNFSFRYEPETGRLILPLDTSNSIIGSNFVGFFIFRVSADEITPECRIEHGYAYERNTCTCTVIAPRSFFINGDVVTVMENYVRSTDLETCSGEWNTDINDNDCCGY